MDRGRPARPNNRAEHQVHSPWRVNIAEIQAADTSSDSGDDEAEPINHPELKRKFEAHAKSLENKQVKVCLFRLAF